MLIKLPCIVDFFRPLVLIEPSFPQKLGRHILDWRCVMYRSNPFVIPLIVLLASFLLPAPLVPPAAADSTIFGFNLIKPNTAQAASGPFMGDTLRTTGSGSFNTVTHSIMGSGSFTHIKADGTVFARGTWEATSFVSFKSFGGPNPGLQGGVLLFLATLFPEGGIPMPGLAVTFTCKINASPGTQDGTTVGDFTIITGGETLLHVN